MVVHGIGERIIAGQMLLLSVKIVNCSSIPIASMTLSSDLNQYTLLSDAKVLVWL